jgi:hypothetical protein
MNLARRLLQISLLMLITRAAMAQVDYNTQIQPIFNANCSCHFPAFSGWDPSSYASVIASVGVQYGIKIVQPGNSAGSPLYDKISSVTPLHGARMPFGGPYLSNAQITAIKNWIDQGATEKSTAAVARNRGAVPEDFSLSQNYPNPFNPSTRISFSIIDARFVSLRIYDVIGNEVAVLVNRRLDAGVYTVDWNAGGVGSGVYFYQLRAVSTEGSAQNNFIATKKLVIEK